MMFLRLLFSIMFVDLGGFVRVCVAEQTTLADENITGLLHRISGHLTCNLYRYTDSSMYSVKENGQLPMCVCPFFA